MYCIVLPYVNYKIKKILLLSGSHEKISCLLLLIIFLEYTEIITGFIDLMHMIIHLCCTCMHYFISNKYAKLK